MGHRQTLFAVGNDRGDDQPANKIGAARCAKNAEGCKARRLLLSDYGESHWLTFIGMPYRHLAIARESLQMAQSKEHVITLTRSSVVQASENISRDLLIDPLEPIKKPFPERVRLYPFRWRHLSSVVGV